MPPEGYPTKFKYSWAASDVFLRLKADGIFITDAQASILDRAAGIIEGRYPELKFTKDFKQNEESIGRASQKLLGLLDNRPYEAWAVWGDSKTHEPDYYLDKEDTIETLKLLKESTREQIYAYEIIAKNKFLHNRTLRDRFLHWSVLRDFWRTALKRKIQKSYDPINEKHTGPFIRFIMIMSERAPFADDITEGKIADWIKAHGNKSDVDEDIAMYMENIRNLEKENCL